MSKFPVTSVKEKSKFKPYIVEAYKKLLNNQYTGFPQNELRRKRDDSTFEKMETQGINILKTDIDPNIKQPTPLDTDAPNQPKPTYADSKITCTSKMQTTQAELQKAGQDDVCRICFEKPFDTVLFPCGHCGLCFVCCLKLLMLSGVCPLCRSKAGEIYRINIKTKIYNVVEIMEVVDQGNIGMYIELLDYINSLTKQG